MAVVATRLTDGQLDIAARKTCSGLEAFLAALTLASTETVLALSNASNARSFFVIGEFAIPISAHYGIESNREGQRWLDLFFYFVELIHQYPHYGFVVLEILYNTKRASDLSRRAELG